MIQSLLHSLSRKEREKGGPGPNPMNNKQACIYKLVNTFFKSLVVTSVVKFNPLKLVCKSLMNLKVKIEDECE